MIGPSKIEDMIDVIGFGWAEMYSQPLIMFWVMMKDNPPIRSQAMM